MGVGTNVIEASWEALRDALAYGLMAYVSRDESEAAAH